MNRALSPPRIPTIITLGIVGTTQTADEKGIWAAMDAIVEHLEMAPQRLLVPSEGNSSIYIQSWADSKKIQYTVFECDWVRLGRRAAMMRDSAIQKEADHFLLIKSPKGKSDRLDKLGATLAKKGKIVFVLGEELEHLEVEKPVKASKRLAPERKQDNGIMPWLQKSPSQAH